MFVLTTIPQPKVKLYFVEGNKFSTDKEDAYKFESRQSAMIEQDRFMAQELDTQIEEA